MTLAFDIETDVQHTGGVNMVVVRSKGGLHPYYAGLFFLVRERHGGGWPPQDVGQVSGWLAVRMLAHQFDKTPRAVAGDLIDTWRAVEEGHVAP